jgi:SulP family sulfate permease
LDEKGWKVFELKGSLFFASIAAFQNIFNPANDPEVVVIDFKEAKVVDHSAWQRLTA